LVAHVTKVFLKKVPVKWSFCSEIEKTFLVPNSIDNGTVEMSDVHLILRPPCYLWWHKSYS